MEIKALGYIGLQDSRLSDWCAFAGDLLGMQMIDKAAKLRAFRMDDRKQRLFVDGKVSHGNITIGWEVVWRDDLDQLAARLDAHDVAVTRGSSALADERHVSELICFDDPAGNRLEVFWQPELADTLFVPGRPLSGFKTGPLGMGHIVLNVEDAAPLLTFYRDLLGFEVSDFGKSPIEMYFFHVNERHHSFAVIGTGRSDLHHFMVEMQSIDDVGQCYDLALEEKDRIAYTLGRHTNDWMTSFYATSPSGFFVECGWGGRQIDVDNWQAHETFDGPSFWGHDRLHQTPQMRNAMREMRLNAARKGMRAEGPPVIDCPWLDSVIARRRD